MSDHRPGPGWRRGSEAQRATAAALTALPAHTHFFHGLPIGRTGDDVDHLVIGPTGGVGDRVAPVVGAGDHHT